MLECSWEKAEQVCGCKPWDVPASDHSNRCFILGNVCFSQIMRKIEDGEMEVSCDCSADCVYSSYTMKVQDRTMMERTSTHFLQNEKLGTKLPVIGTDQVTANGLSKSGWYNMGRSVTRSSCNIKNNISGEYVTDMNYSLLGQEKLLEHRFPRPIISNHDFLQPMSLYRSSELLVDRKKNIFKVAMFYQPDQNKVTKVRIICL